MTDETSQAPAADVAAQGSDPAPGQTTAAAPDYSWVPPAYVKDGQPDLTAFSQHYSELAAEAARRADLPQAPDAYQFTLPADFNPGLPEGVKFDLGVDDPDYAPIFTDLGAFMKEAGLPQDAATNLMGLMGRYKAAETQKLYAAAQEDYAKLGPTPASRDARMAKLATSITGRLPADQAKALMDTVKSSAAVVALERLMSLNLGPQSAPQVAPPADPLASRYPSNFRAA
jgi:hypothetical protein